MPHPYHEHTLGITDKFKLHVTMPLAQHQQAVEAGYSHFTPLILRQTPTELVVRLDPNPKGAVGCADSDRPRWRWVVSVPAAGLTPVRAHKACVAALEGGSYLYTATGPFFPTVKRGAARDAEAEAEPQVWTLDPETPPILVSASDPTRFVPVATLPALSPVPDAEQLAAAMLAAAEELAEAKEEVNAANRRLAAAKAAIYQLCHQPR